MMANVEDKRNFLRKAGDAVGQFFVDRDKEYANAVLEGMSPKYEGQPNFMQSLQLHGATLAGQPLSSSKSIFDTSHETYAPYQDTAVKAAAAGFRYGLPAAGITLAGKGLYDLTAGMNEQTSGTLMP